MPHNQDHTNTKNIKFAFFLNFSFALLEIVGGYWTNSLAIVSDAIHDLGDSLSLALAWYLENYSRKERDYKFSYGYKRFSLLGALINIIILIVGAIFVLNNAIPRLFNPETTKTEGMIVFAIIGIVINGLAVIRMRQSTNMNSRIVALHLFEDVLGWIAILIVSIVIAFTQLYVLDPILSIIITIYILYNVFRNLKKTIELFMQAVPDNIDLKMIENDLNSIYHVKSTHHTHVWSLDGEHHVISTHIVLDDQISKEDLLCIREEIKQKLRKLNISHSTVEFEFGEKDCMIS